MLIKYQCPFPGKSYCTREIYLYMLHKINTANCELTDLTPVTYKVFILPDKYCMSLSDPIWTWVWTGHLAATVYMKSELTKVTNNTGQMIQYPCITSSLINSIHVQNNVQLNNYLYLNKTVTKDTSNIMFCKFMIWRKLNLKKCFSPCFKPRNWCWDINSLSTWHIIKKQHILYKHTALYTGQFRT